MPIYEFKCRKCQEYIEILVMGNQADSIEMQCSKCGSRELERILSSVGYSMAAGGNGRTQNATQTRSCSSGSCTTWNLPGHSQ